MNEKISFKFFSFIVFFVQILQIIKQKQGGLNMKSFGSAIKGMAVGLAVGSLATMVLTNNKATKKLKKNATNAVENISSMFKMN